MDRTRSKVSAGWNGEEMVLGRGARRTDRLMIMNCVKQDIERKSGNANMRIPSSFYS